MPGRVDEHVGTAVDLDRACRRRRASCRARRARARARCPTIALTSDDLPTFGRPMIAMCTGACAGAPAWAARAHARAPARAAPRRRARARRRPAPARRTRGERARRARPPARRVSTLLATRITGDRRAAGARDLEVERRRALARVDDEQDEVGLLDRRVDLPAHGLDQRLRRERIEAARVDDRGLPALEAHLAVEPVARHAGHVAHERLAAADEAVEERGLADVRAGRRSR